MANERAGSIRLHHAAAAGVASRLCYHISSVFDGVFDGVFARADLDGARMPARWHAAMPPCTSSCRVPACMHADGAGGGAAGFFAARAGHPRVL